MFAIDRHGEPLLMVPVTGRLGYQFSSDLLGLGQFDLPVFVNAGVGFMKLADLFNVNLVLRPARRFSTGTIETGPSADRSASG